MRRWTLLPPLALASLLSWPAYASSVEYVFQAPFSSDSGSEVDSLSGGFFNFDYTAPGFITADTTVSAAAAKCTVVFGTCTSVQFNPASSRGSDLVTINYTYSVPGEGEDDSRATFVRASDDPTDVPASQDFDFAANTFITPGGPYVSNNDFQGELTVIASDVSAVPLPASAPMFGAALVALGAVGYGLKRKAKAAAV